MLVFQGYNFPKLNKTAEPILNEDQRERFLGHNGTWVGARDAFIDASQRQKAAVEKETGASVTSVFNGSQLDAVPADLLDGKSTRIDLGRRPGAPIFPKTKDAKSRKAYSTALKEYNAKLSEYDATLAYYSRTLGELKNYLGEFGILASVEMIQDSKGQNVGCRLVPQQTANEMQWLVRQKLEKEQREADKTPITPVQTTTKLSSVTPSVTETQLDMRLMDNVDSMRKALTSLAFFNPDDLSATYALLQDVGKLNTTLQTRLSQLFGTNMAVIQQQTQAFWNEVMDGAPAYSFAAKAFENGYASGQSEAAVLNVLRGVTLMRALDDLLKDSLTGRISSSSLESAVNDAVAAGSIGSADASAILAALQGGKPATQADLKKSLDDAVPAILTQGQADLLYTKVLNLNVSDAQTQISISSKLNQLINTNSLEQAAAVLYGPKGEALDAFLMNRKISLSDENGQPKSAGEKFIEAAMLISDNLTTLRNQTAQFASLYGSSYALLATSRTSVAISDAAWSDMLSPLPVKPTDRGTFDAFTLLSFVSASEGPEFRARISDQFFYKTVSRLTYLSPAAALLLAERPEILLNLRKNIDDESIALSLLDIGLRDLRSIYAGSAGLGVRFMAMKDYADDWIGLSADADLLSHVKSSTIRGTEYGQIEVADPRLELFQTYGRTDMTFSLDVFSRWRLGGLVFNDLQTYNRFGAPYGDDLRMTRDYNLQQQDRFFKSRPYVYIADAYWSPPPLGLRLDYNAYNDALYAVLQRIRKKYGTSESFQLASLGAGLQGSGAPGRGDFDTGVQVRGRDWGQSAFGGYSHRDQTAYDKDKGVISEESNTHALLTGSNLGLDGIKLYGIFYDWLNNQTKTRTNIGGTTKLLEKVDEKLVGSSDADLYGFELLMGNAHYYQKTESAEGGGVRTDTSTRDDHEFFLRCTDGWYRLNFNTRQRANFIEFLNNAGVQVDSDGYLSHLYQEVANKTADEYRINAGLEKYNEKDKLLGTDTKGSIYGAFVGIKLPGSIGGEGQTVAISAKTIEKEGIGALAQLLGKREDGTVVMASVANVRRPIQQLFFGPQGYYTSYYGLGPRAYTFGEQRARDNRPGEDMVLANFVWQALEQYRIQAFGGGTKTGQYGIAGGSYTDKGLGIGAYYTYRTPTGNISTSQPAEVFVGFGQNGYLFSWPISSTGYYYQSQMGGAQTEIGSFTTSVKLSANTTLYANAYVNKNSIAILSSQRVLGSIQTQITSLGNDIRANKNLFDTDYNAGIAFRRDWTQRLLGIHSLLENYVVGDEYRSGIAQFSLGLKAKDGGVTQVGFANTLNGGLFSFIHAPNNNLTFFTTLPTGGEKELGVMGGFKYTDADIGFAGLYHEVDNKSFAAFQMSLPNKLGVQLQGGHQYARASLLIGDRSANILFDYVQAGGAGREFEGFGATYTYLAAHNLDVALGFTRGYMKGTLFNTTGLTGSAFWDVSPDTQLGFGVTNLSVLRENWWYAQFGLRTRF